MFRTRNNGGILLKLITVLVVLGLVGYAALHRLQGTARVKAVNRDTAVDAVTGSVTIHADKGMLPLKAEIAGKVKDSSAIDPGKSFKKGDVLVELDTTDIDRLISETERKYLDEKLRTRMNLTGGKPELLEAAESLPDAERERILRENNPNRRDTLERLEQSERLLKLGDVSTVEVRTLRRTLENIDLDLKNKILDEKRGAADYKALKETLHLQREKMFIKALFDGKVQGAMTYDGAMVDQGQTLAIVFANKKVVAAKISEEDFGRVKIGQKARLRLLTYGDKMYDATVSKLLPAADESQRFTVYLDVDVDPEMLEPNSTGEATITLAEQPNTMVILRRALFGDNNRVFVVKDGRVERREVKVGFMSSMNVVEIREGLKDGELYIIDQIENFRHGDRVRVEQSQ